MTAFSSLLYVFYYLCNVNTCNHFGVQWRQFDCLFARQAEYKVCLHLNNKVVLISEKGVELRTTILRKFIM